VADISILDSSTAAAPKSYTVKGAQEIILRSVTGSYDGTGAAGSYIPAVQILDPAGFVVGTFVANTTLAAGASADVSWFPGLKAPGTSSGGGGGNKSLRVPLDTPDSSGNGYAANTAVLSFTNVRAVVPAFTHSVLGTWEGRVIVPTDYTSSAIVVLYLVTNSILAGKFTRFRVSTFVVASGSSLDFGYTDEAYVNIAVPGTTAQLFTQSYALSTTPVPGNVLNVKVTRDGGNIGDTLGANDVLLWACNFTYS